MTARGISWGADTRISLPVPSGDVVQVPMHGFGMSQYRLVHDITPADAEELSVPPYAPPGYPGPVVAGDADLDFPAPPPAGSA